MSLEYSSKVTVTWKVEGVNGLLEKGENGAVYHYSPSFDGGRWKIRMQLSENKPDHAGFFLTALSSSGADRGSYKFSFTTLDLDEVELLQSPLRDTHSFTVDSTWGWSAAVKKTTLRTDSVCSRDAFLLRAEIEPELPSMVKPSVLIPDYRKIMQKLLDHAEYSDVVLTLSSTATPARLFSNKLLLTECSSYFRSMFSSGFCESAQNELELHPSPASPLNRYDGDPAEFHPFGAFEGEAPPEPRGSIASSSGPPSPERARSISSFSMTSEVPLKERSSGNKTFLIVNVEDCSYSTLRALLLFLHGGKLSFHPSISNLLVSFQAASCESPTTASASARDAWLEKNTKQTEPAPCRPHALYRLADRWLLDDASALAKEFILRGLTVENVAYEAFSQLSRDFEDVQKPILDFLLKNWKEVKATRAWLQAMELLEEGELPGGAAVLRKVHGAL